MRQSDAIEGQMTIQEFLSQPFKIRKPVRLIELFGGVGSQAMALEELGVDFEHYRLVEFDKYPVASYNAIHGTNFTPLDIRQVKGVDLGIVDVKRFTYLLTYLLLSLPRFKRCREAKRNDEGQRHKIGPVMGSGKTAKRSGEPAASADYGECATGTRQKEHGRLSEVVRFSTG